MTPENELPPQVIPSLELKVPREIALDFAQKIHQKFDVLIKAIVLFGSTVKDTINVGSDIDIVLIVDDATFNLTNAQSRE